MRRLFISGYAAALTTSALCGSSLRMTSTTSSPPDPPPPLSHNVPRSQAYNGKKRQRNVRKGIRKARRDGAAKRSAVSSPYTAPDTDFFDATAVPRSLDVGAQEELTDVEKFFPQAMAHLKETVTTPDVSADRTKRKWHDNTHTVNVDGFRPMDRPSEEDATAGSQARSFFDQGSLDIRGGLRDLAQERTRAAHASPQSREERLSPDVLQLTGGKPRRHGLALAERSNAAPADQTLEPEDANYMGRNGDQGSEFGDTPVQLTDMLRERLMELKGNRLREESNDAFMPRRLPLKTDAELSREQAQGQVEQQRLLKLATQAAQKPAKTRRATLADYLDDEELAGTETASAPVPAVLRDGASEEQRRSAASALRRVHGYEAGTAAMDLLSDLDRPFGASRGGARDTDAIGNEEGSGVYLLRVLPRASLSSRREAAAIIASGQVRVNNVVERNPFRLVLPEDDIHVAGHKSRLRFAPPRLWIYHKPANVVVSRNDVEGRTLISKHARILGMDHLIPVGSLPMRAHGLLLLTNDGELSRYLENPRSSMQQTYLLRVRPAIDAVLAHKLNTEGININGRQYRGAMEFMVNPAAQSRYSVKVKVRSETLPIAHVMQHLGRKVERGGRMSFGPFSLSTLPVGSLREVTVPPAYAEHLGAVWRPFVERDWPYFRRQRVRRLRRLSRYRELTPRELEELDDYTYAEMQDALRFDEQELATAANAREDEEAAWRLQKSREAQELQRPSYFHGEALPNDFPTSRRGRSTATGGEDVVGTLEGTEWAERQYRDDDDDHVIEDITAVV